MIVTTTNSIDGHQISDYKGIVFGEVINGVNMFKDIAAGFRNIVGGRSKGYEGELLAAREEALDEMSRRAEALGADAVVGVNVDYETLADGSMLMVTASGTAVKLTL